MNGLLQFIKDIRQCKNKEEENIRVIKELAKIRGKFENKGISGYQRKKYVWKMIFIYILGYEIYYGHFQAANLLNSSQFSENYIGYIAVGSFNNPKIRFFTNRMFSIQKYKEKYDEKVSKVILEFLKTLINVNVTKSVNRNYANHGILFEETTLLIHYGDDVPKKYIDEIIHKLGVFISVREPNFK